MIKRILVGLGGTEYTLSAINKAVAIAMDQNAELTGVSILDEQRLTSVGPVPIGGGQQARELAKDRLQKAKERIDWSVQEFTEACRAAGLKHRALCEVGEPISLMIDQARYHDVTIFGLRSLFEFDLVEDPHDALVRLVQSGVRPIIAVSKGFYPVKKVLIAYSGSMESAKAMKRFIQMRLWPKAKLQIVTFEHEPDKAKNLVREAADYCRANGFSPEETTFSGSAKEDLLEYMQEWEADMTVVGNSAKNLIMRKLFGETALNVIRNTERPIFLAQ